MKLMMLFVMFSLTTGTVLADADLAIAPAVGEKLQGCGANSTCAECVVSGGGNVDAGGTVVNEDGTTVAAPK